MMPSLPQLLIVLAIVLILFGGKFIRGLGTTMGDTVRGFKGLKKELATLQEDEDFQDAVSGVQELKREYDKSKRS